MLPLKGHLPKELGPYGINGLRGSFTTINRYSRAGTIKKAPCRSWSCGRNFSMLICPSIPSTLCASCFNTSADWENKYPEKIGKISQESWKKIYLNHSTSVWFLDLSDIFWGNKHRRAARFVAATRDATHCFTASSFPSKRSSCCCFQLSDNFLETNRTCRKHSTSPNNFPSIISNTLPTMRNSSFGSGWCRATQWHLDTSRCHWDRDRLPSSSKSASKSWGSAVLSCSRSASVAFKTCRSPQQLMDEPSVWAEISKFGLELLGRTCSFWITILHQQVHLDAYHLHHFFRTCTASRTWEVPKGPALRSMEVFKKSAKPRAEFKERWKV